MATQQRTVDYLLEQATHAGAVSTKPMIGEYGVYDVAAALESAEHPLDGIAAFVEGPAGATLPNTRALRRDVRDGSLALDQVADAVGIVGTVGVNDAALRQVISRCSAARQSAAWQGVR